MWDSPDFQRFREIAAQPDIEGVLLITQDGFLVASSLHWHIEEDRLTIISAAFAVIASSASNLNRCLSWGGSQPTTYIKCRLGYVLAMPLNEEFLLIVLRGPEAKLGLSPAPEPIIPIRPPGRLNAYAQPEYDEEK